jgi:hypothetical protein
MSKKQIFSKPNLTLPGLKKPKGKKGTTGTNPGKIGPIKLGFKK